MTAASPLHVVVPTVPDPLSSTSPQTPYTPQSAGSVHQLDMPPPQSPPVPNQSEDHSPSVVEMNHVESDREGAPHKPITLSPRGAEEVGQDVALPEMRVAPPDTLPPSPPLTETEGREEDTEAPVEHGGGPGATHAPEDDIVNWQSSMDGSYHEDDLGYSTNEATPIDVHGPAVPGGGTQLPNGLQNMLSAQYVPDHPLRLDIHPPSPPPWEVIDPPDTNNIDISSRGALFPGTASRGQRLPKVGASRPLIPHSSYYFGPPPIDSAYGTNPRGRIGLHHPREIVRVERDFSGGEVIQFAPVYPLELEGRISPTQFLETINSINELLISAHSLRHSLFDNTLAFFSLQISKLMMPSHYEKEMNHLRLLIEELNKQLYNPVGLNILWPREVAFMFLEIEYY